MSDTFPDLPQLHIQALANRFGLGLVAARQQTAKVYQLESGRGAFALRCFNPEATRAHATATQQARAILTAAGLAVGAALPTTSGETLLASEGLFWELQPWIVHSDDGHSWPNVVGAASTLGRIHDALAACDAMPEQRDDPWRSPGALAEQLAANAERLRAVGRGQGMTIDGHIDQSLHILETLRDEGLLVAAPRQLTHGDYQGRNLLFHDGALVGVIDFERLEHRPRLYDLAWPFVFWRFFGTDEGNYTERDWQFARAACAAYAAACATGPGDREWATLPRLMASIPARGVADAVNEDAPVAEIVAFAKALPFATWLVDNPRAAIARLIG